MKKTLLAGQTLLALGCVMLSLAVVRGDDAAEIRARTEARRPVLRALLQSGAIAEAPDGYLEIRNREAVGEHLPVIRAENADRKTAYTAIAESTGTTSEEVGRRQAERIRARRSRE